MTLGDRVLVTLGPAIAQWVVRGLAATLRLRELGREQILPLWEQGIPLIYAIWHGRILMLPCLYARGHRVHVLTSRSRDGELEARFLRRFRFQTVRGSTTRGGAEALRALAHALRDGGEVAIAPDGPLGPAYIVQPGIIALARLTGAPIIPLAFSAAPAWRVKSWDEFLVPKPFARAVVSFGQPLLVPRGADRATQHALGKTLESALRELTWQADTRVGSG